MDFAVVAVAVVVVFSVPVVVAFSLLPFKLLDCPKQVYLGP